MKLKYERPIVEAAEVEAEGVFMASGTVPVACQSLWRKGVWAATDYNYNIYDATKTVDQARGCEGCPANWGPGRGCGLLVGDPANFVANWEKNALKPSWEFAGTDGDEKDANKWVGIGVQ
ncbi:hypothetical protein FACS1894111_11210 [Clostridia bacterium]|nr:hypothetical protein FACS1894111_11210 [Clostridia bacterium]